MIISIRKLALFEEQVQEVLKGKETTKDVSKEDISTIQKIAFDLFGKITSNESYTIKTTKSEMDNDVIEINFHHNNKYIGLVSYFLSSTSCIICVAAYH